MVPSSRSRVPRNTATSDQRAITEQTRTRLQHFAGNPGRIDHRLQELEREWDIERTIELNASSLAFAGIAAGALHDRRWLILSALVTGFLFQHAIQGWCPPVPVLRKLGFRTLAEIEQERNALKALRGDYRQVTRRLAQRGRNKSPRVAAKAARKAAAA
jgi:hypothetical protein